MERLVWVRKHHVGDIMRQVSKSQPDSLPAYIPKRIRDANTHLVEAILGGAKIVVVENGPDAICRSCRLLSTCDFKDS